MPFLLGVLIAPVGLYVRRQLPETVAGQRTHDSGAAVLVDLARHHARSIVLGILVICGGTVSTYVFNYMTTYAITTLHLSAAVGTTLTLMGSPAQIAGFALGAWLDRFGRKRLLVLSRVLFLAILYPAYTIITSPDATVGGIVAINMLLNFMFGVGIGPIYAFLSEAFPQSVRSSGLGIVYALGVTIFGGSTQFVVAWLIDATQNPMIPAWYQIAANIVAIIGVVLMASHSEIVEAGVAPIARVRPSRGTGPLVETIGRGRMHE